VISKGFINGIGVVIALGRCLWLGLSAHTAQALTTWSVSAPIPNAELPPCDAEL